MEGTVQQVADRHVVRFERHLNHSVEEVWAALTRPEKLAAWLAQADIELTEGGHIQLRFDNTGYVTLGTITQLKQPSLLEYTWNGQDGLESLLRWELHPDDRGCLLVFTQTLLDRDRDRLPSLLAGWHTHFELLSQTLVGQQVAWRSERWEELYDRYRQMPL